MWSQPDWDECYERLTYNKDEDTVTIEIQGIVNDEYYSNEKTTIKVDDLFAFINNARRGQANQMYISKGSGVKEGDEDG